MKRVLVVDDNKDVLEILQIAFEARGFEVLGIYKGEETIQTVESFSPHVILLDVFLGEVNGIDICNTLKDNPDTKNIPLVMFSAHSTAEAVLGMCSAEAFIGKPFNIHHLTKVIEAQVQKSN